MPKPPSRPKSRPKGIAEPPPRERRSSSGDPGSLRWFKSLMGRPLGLVRRDGNLHLVLVDRRRPPELVEAAAVEKIRQELQACFLAHPGEDELAVMRHLLLVHDVMGSKGWDGVQALGSSVLGLAMVQAEMLSETTPSKRLAWLIEQLRIAKVAAEVREERMRPKSEAIDSLEVSESTAEQFEALERHWAETESPDLEA
jgi:hypothetical protein